MSTIESQYLESGDFSGYQGEWVVILDKEVVAHDKDLPRLYDKVTDLKLARTPLFHLIPAKDETDNLHLVYPTTAARL